MINSLDFDVNFICGEYRVWRYSPIDVTFVCWLVLWFLFLINWCVAIVQSDDAVVVVGWGCVCDCVLVMILLTYFVL